MTSASGAQQTSPPDSLGEDWAESLRAAGRDDAARRADTSWLYDNPDPIALPYRWAGEIMVRRQLEYTIKGLLGPGSVGAVVGSPGAGKSAFMAGPECAVACGRMWHGHRVPKGFVLHLALEGQAGVDHRYAACRQVGLLDEDSPLAVVTIPVALIADADAIISTALVAAAQAGERPALTVIDTLSRALAGQDENSGEVMTAATRAADRIAVETRSSIVLVHHFGKSIEAGARGHSSLLGAVDLQIDVLRAGDDRRAVVKKNREGEEGREYPFRLEVVQLGQDDEGDPITSVVAVPSDAAPTRLMLAKTQNQRSAVTALRVWCAKQSNPSPHLASDEFHKLLADAGIAQRQRRFDVATWLVNAGVITRAVGGYSVHPAVLK